MPKIIHDYGDRISQMADDARAQDYPRPFHVDIRQGPGPRGRDVPYIVATWKHGETMWLAWKRTARDEPGQLKDLLLWSGLAQLRGFTTRGGIADYRCWPLPGAGDADWVVIPVPPPASAAPRGAPAPPAPAGGMAR